MKNCNLINARKEKGYTQQDLAILLGVGTSTVSNWETGYSQPNLDTGIRVSSLLDKDVTFLFGSNVQVSQT
ncbi:helix-turn-helix transcriptional regulator [Listeria sp. FSL L7-1582]|uniref:helix-turn-helix transcriptional regulator n=1 Tax=Listeria portnoyi TaxID=2713504 RepID=UPI00164DD74F|nr:helix-turn-helix transcriptional regulator [Listeria portnoyi]MBC6308162.1 helix-turn-helix transcriptional regulator [Listeria portnoyi]